MSFYYIEFNDKAEILSYGQASSLDMALKYTKETIKEVTRIEYELISACKGDIKRGIFTLKELETSIQKTIQNAEETK